MVDRNFSEQMEIIKWFSIIGIFTFHFSDTIVRYDIIPLNSLFEKLLHIGSQGIHVFFILSVFFIHLKYLQSKKDFQVFKRVKKLYPQYIISVIFVLIIYLIYGKNISIFEILINILPIVRNMSEEYIRTINGNWWFLQTLIEFYIFIKITEKLLVKITDLKLILMTLSIYSVYVLFYTNIMEVDSRNLNPYSSFFLNYIYDFTIGVLFARFYFLKKLKLDYIYLFFIFGIIFEGLGYAVTKKLGILGYNINDIFFSIGIMFLMLALSKLFLSFKKLDRTKTILVKNTILIYYIYLIHHPIILIILDLNSGINSYTFLIFLYILASIIVVVISILLHTLRLKLQKS